MGTFQKDKGYLHISRENQTDCLAQSHLQEDTTVETNQQAIGSFQSGCDTAEKQSHERHKQPGPQELHRKKLLGTSPTGSTQEEQSGLLHCILGPGLR